MRELLAKFLPDGLKLRAASDPAASGHHHLVGREWRVWQALHDLHPELTDRTSSKPWSIPYVCVEGNNGGPGCGAVWTPTRRLASGKHCENCRQPIAWTPRPGDLFVTYRERFDPTCRKLVCWRNCAGCGELFGRVDKATTHCKNCDQGVAARVRRHRGGSPTGSRVWRYVFADGSEVGSVSFTVDPTGRSLLLEAVDGVIETRDAEIAERLEAVPGIRACTAERR